MIAAGITIVLALGTTALLRRPSQRAVGHAIPIPPAERRVTVEVLNGTERQGLARSATRMLRQRGVDVVFLGNADSTADSTQILIRRGGPPGGATVRAALGLGKVAVAIDTLRRVDVSVILGRDFRPGPELHP